MKMKIVKKKNRTSILGLANICLVFVAAFLSTQVVEAVNLSTFICSPLSPESEVTITYTENNLLIDIDATNSSYQFWSSRPTARISYSTHLPLLSLVANIGKPDEFRLVLQPNNIIRKFDAPPQELELEADSTLVGKVILFDAHRVQYVVKLSELEILGSSFFIVAGNPFVQYTKREVQQEF